MLDLILRTANLILKLAPSVLKGVVNRECQVGMPLVGGRGPCHIDFSAVGNGETYMDFVLATLAVPLTGSFHNDTACGYAAPAPFKFGQVRIDSVFNCGVAGNPSNTISGGVCMVLLRSEDETVYVVEARLLLMHIKARASLVGGAHSLHRNSWLLRLDYRNGTHCDIANSRSASLGADARRCRSAVDLHACRKISERALPF
jgi:hypothetical protein